MIQIQINWSCGGVSYSMWDANLPLTTALNIPGAVEIIILGYEP